MDSLPGPRAGWNLIEVTVVGNVLDAKGEPMKEVLECWVRNPAELVADLMGNPEFADCIHFAPKEEYVDSEDVAERLETSDGPLEKERVLTDFVNTDWWKRVDVSGIGNSELTAVVLTVMAGRDQEEASRRDNCARDPRV